MFSEINDPRNKGDVTPFIIQFLEFILEVEKELVDDVDRRLNDLTFFMNKIEQLKLDKFDKSVVFILLQNSLFDDEGLTKDRISKIIKKSYNTISKAFNHIEAVNSGVLRCVKSGNRKLYDLDLNTLAEL